MDQIKELTQTKNLTIQQIVEKIVSEGFVCDNCLGRQFANLSTGWTNKERGYAIKLFILMELDAQFKIKNNSNEDAITSKIKDFFNVANQRFATVPAPSGLEHRSFILNELQENSLCSKLKKEEDEVCWICLDIFKTLEEWADKIIHKLEGIEYDTFLIGTKLSGLLSENEEIVCLNYAHLLQNL